MQYNNNTGNSFDSNNKEILARTFKRNNNLGAKDAYYASKKYDLNAYKVTGPSIVSLADASNQIIEYNPPISVDGVYKLFNETHLPLYGTVDRKVIPLQPKKQYLSYYLGNSAGFSALDFVMNSFINMRKAYTRGIFEGKGASTGFILSNLEITKARVDESVPFGQLLDSITNFFIRYASLDNKNRKQIITPENFVGYFSNYLIKHSINNIVTFSTMVLTEKTDINFNGICLDVAGLPYDSDKEKVRDFILDPNFSYYLDTAKSFGFVIAKEYPFKLIANLNSYKMRDNICACGSRYLNGLVLNTADDIVDFYFEPSYLYDINSLRTLFTYAYQRFFDTFKFETVSTYYNGYLHNKRILRFGSQLDHVLNLLSDKRLLNLYIILKNNEIRLQYSDKSLQMFTVRADYIYDNFGIEPALKYINEKFRLAIETATKKSFTNIESFSNEEALALIRLTRYDY